MDVLEAALSHTIGVSYLQHDGWIHLDIEIFAALCLLVALFVSTCIQNSLIFLLHKSFVMWDGDKSLAWEYYMDKIFMKGIHKNASGIVIKIAIWR